MKSKYLVLLLFATSCTPNLPEINTANHDSIIRRRDSINQVISDSVAAIEKQRKEKWKLTKAGKIGARHPWWTESDCERISRGEIWIGMHIAMVAEIYGQPDDINVSNYGSGNQYQYVWHEWEPGYFYTKEDRIVKSYN